MKQVLAEIQVGVWRPPSMSAGGEDPTFHEFASRWWFARKSELRPTTQADYGIAVVRPWWVCGRVMRHPTLELVMYSEGGWLGRQDAIACRGGPRAADQTSAGPSSAADVRAAAGPASVGA